MKIAGIDIGGTKCAVILGSVDNEGKPLIIDKTFISTKDYPDPYQMISRMQQDLELLLSRHQVDIKDLASIGISCGGPLDSVKGIVLSPPNLPGWDEIPIVKLFEDKFGVPTAIQNDANACALVEWMMGAGRGTRNMIFEKALSMSQNLKMQQGSHIDNHYMLIVDLAKSDWDWQKDGEPPMDNPAYYLRYCKTFNRMGGEMHYLTADNRDFLLAIYQELSGK